ncbi:MAG: hypothetical protein CMO30_23235 [Tistrella sp.]|uniref:Nucleotidyl transferase AbiEii/AbiGii toxin family protein n=2 Tax=Tistrella TaxID=171436 RepID=A0A3B9IQ20_9PROT|nr:hypothetical protein [Tistrella sp.]MBA78191.1 hypothetical protein [Tistrella sp.]HAE49798.1 hypothetical protein [Tistrella mobilis]
MSAPFGRLTSRRSRRASFRLTTRKGWRQPRVTRPPGCGPPSFRSPTQPRPITMDDVAGRGVADDYPDVFADPDTRVTVLSARRTFWEKATALHAEAHRPAASPTPQYFSRHYYDLAMLLDTDEGQAAVADLNLLAQVARHKATFFRSSWASYDTARPGTLRLTPDNARIKDLKADYRAMAPMMFDQTPPPFGDILEKIAALQDAINSQGQTQPTS